MKIYKCCKIRDNEIIKVTNGGICIFRCSDLP